MTGSLVREVENAVAHGDPEARRAMLRRTTDLFLDKAERLTEEHVSAFDAVIIKLAQSVETAARAALSDALADLGNAPRATVRDLAFDPDVSVAGPILARSIQIAEGDLVRIAELRGQDHLYALSRRHALSERVTDVLVTRGDGQVLRSVAGNEGARFSPMGFDTLASRAEADEALGEALSLRRDVPAHHMAHLVATAKARVARKLASEFGAEAATAAVQQVVKPLRGDMLSLQEAVAIVDGWLGEQALTHPAEADLVRWLAEGRVMEALVGFARAAALPPEIVLRAYQGAHADPLLFLIRSLRYGWATFKAFLVSKTGQEPPPEELRGLFEAFQALSVATAQRVVRFTSARDQMQKAG